MKNNPRYSVKTLFAAAACVGLLLTLLTGCPNPTDKRSSEKQLTEFKFEKEKNTSLTADVVGTIDQTSKSIMLILPHGTKETKFKATFTASAKARVFIKDAAQTSGETENDFKSGVMSYIVQAENGTEQRYVVQVEVAPAEGQKSNGNRITSFGFSKDVNPGLSTDVEGVLGGYRGQNGFYFVKFPAGTTEATIKNLKPIFTASNKAKLSVNGAELKSMETAFDFYNLKDGVKITVTAENGDERLYTIVPEIDLPNASESEVAKYFGSYYTFIPALNSKAVIVLEKDKVTLYSTAMSMDYVNVEWEKKEDGSYTCTTYKTEYDKETGSIKRKLPQIKNLYGKGGYDFAEKDGKIIVKTNIMRTDVTAEKGEAFVWKEGGEYKKVTIHL